MNLTDALGWYAAIMTTVAVVGFGYVSWWYYKLMRDSGYIAMLQEDARNLKAGKPTSEDPFSGLRILDTEDDAGT